jgi:hypothetical protein
LLRHDPVAFAANDEGRLGDARKLRLDWISKRETCRFEYPQRPHAQIVTCLYAVETERLTKRIANKSAELAADRRRGRIHRGPDEHQ